MAMLRGARKAAKRTRRVRARRVRVGEPDPRLTPAGGVEAIRETVRVLGLTQALDGHIRAVKTRNRGHGAGELLVAMASCQLTGGDHLVSLDRRRADVAGQRLEPVPTPATSTACGIAKRFGPEHVAGIEAAIGQVNERVLSLVGQVRRSALTKAVTIDGDTTDVEVYGPTKEASAHAYTGARVLRPHIGFWAEAGVPLAAELTGGTDDPRASCVDLLQRCLAALPAGVQQVRARWDAGYFAGELAHACIERDVAFAIGVKRNTAVIRAGQATPDDEWTPAFGMDDTQVAVIDYRPKDWPVQGVSCIARRTAIPLDRIPTGRARKRRTIPTDQLTLALEGRLEHVYGYSFILTSLDVSDAEKLAEVEWWYRHRTDIEALNKDAKLGAALRHLPSANLRVNTVWMWAALLACAISSWLQEITGIDHGNGRGRRTVARLRRELINVPARLTRSAGTTWLRLPPGEQLLATVLPILQQLPRPG